MRGAKGVELAFVATGKSAQTMTLAQAAHLFAPTRQNFVGISLVAHVPHDAVMRRVEHIVKSHRQLDRAQVRAQMPARFGHAVQQVIAQLIGQGFELRTAQSAQIGGRGNGGQQG